jgi:hypothetical protein
MILITILSKIGQQKSDESILSVSMMLTKAKCAEALHLHQSHNEYATHWESATKCSTSQALICNSASESLD